MAYMKEFIVKKTKVKAKIIKRSCETHELRIDGKLILTFDKECMRTNQSAVNIYFHYIGGREVVEIYGVSNMAYIRRNNNGDHALEDGVHVFYLTDKDIRKLFKV